MAKELPGFYYDAKKNRYFPCKRPHAASRPVVSPPLDPKEEASVPGRISIRQRLLYARELCGNVILSHRRKLSFQNECKKKRAMKPVILKCTETEKIGNVALEHIVANVDVPEGSREANILLSAGVGGLLSLRQVRKPQNEKNSEQMHFLYPVLPAYEAQRGATYSAVTTLPSEVSSIVKVRAGSLLADTTSGNFFITTMGAESDPGSVWVLNLNNALDFNENPWEGLCCLSRYKQTLWTVDSDNAGKNISIGTNRGVLRLDTETRNNSWVLRSKSDVLSVQYDTSGRVLSGLRNGSILSLDPRRKQVSSKYSSISAMPSSVCCLSSLTQWDQYFLASSMDGTIRLYDHRLTKRGPVQSYDGNVNSHTRINLGVDPSEKVVLSGGEDFHVRLWDIKSGELLFNKRLMDAAASAVCWPRLEGKAAHGQEEWRPCCYWERHEWGVWLGSYEGIYYMDWL